MARAELTVVLDRLNRRIQVRRVLHPDLLALLENRASGDDAKDVRVPMVTVLVSRVDDETKKALIAAGLSIEAAATSLPLIVGTVALDDLEAVALVEGVKRIEPTRMKQE